jgi:uncharacterized protein DUF3618
MARSPAEIQADIALTRQLIERKLDALERRVPHRWWTPYALFGGAIVLGLVLSRIPLLRVVEVGARAVRTGITVAGAVAAVDHFVAERRST